MFAKLGALALWLSFASAFGITAPSKTSRGATVDLHLTDIGTNHPATIDLLLIGKTINFPLANDVTVAKSIKVEIPDSIEEGYYYINAFDTTNEDSPIARSNGVLIA